MAKKTAKTVVTKKTPLKAKAAPKTKATPKKNAGPKKTTASGAPLVKGVHAMFYSSEADAVRAFFRDTLCFPYTDVGEGWLIFDVPEVELGCHPPDPEHGAPSGTHNISFYCDDIHESVKELKARGVEFTHDVADHGYGLVTYFKVPGGFDVQLYQPRYRKNPR